MLNELIIKVDNQYVSLSPELTVPIQDTNIPIQHCSFRSHTDIFWRVQLLDYNTDTKCWKVNVIDYFPSNIKNFSRQRSTKEVERIAFEAFDWFYLEQHLG